MKNPSDPMSQILFELKLFFGRYATGQNAHFNDNEITKQSNIVDNDILKNDFQLF